MIKVKNLTFIHHNKCLLYDVSCELLSGQVTAFIGESGSGKTTLFKCISQLYPHYSGSITYQDTPLHTYTPQQRIHIVGFVSQYLSLFPHMTVLENCTHPLINMLSIDPNTAQAKAFNFLGLLGIEDLCNRYPSQISGGQQQKVALARALGLNPRVLLLDEATAMLDPHSADALQKILKDLCSTDVTIALSSHDVRFVKNVADRIYFLERGRIIEQCDTNGAQSIETTKFINPFLNSRNTCGPYISTHHPQS